MIRKYFPVVSPIMFGVLILFLGFLNPGYDHFKHTISRLAIERYGWIQTLNFLQLSVGLYLTGLSISATLKQSHAKKFVRAIFIFCAATTAVWAFAPTDRIEGNPLASPYWTPTGIAHAGMVIVFLMLSPIGIHRLTKILAADTAYKRTALSTIFIGYFALIVSSIWIVLFINNWLDGYRGLIQKLIALPVLSWLAWMSIIAVKSHDKIKKYDRNIQSPHPARN